MVSGWPTALDSSGILARTGRSDATLRSASVRTLVSIAWRTMASPTPRARPMSIPRARLRRTSGLVGSPGIAALVMLTQVALGADWDSSGENCTATLASTGPVVLAIAAAICGSLEVPTTSMTEAVSEMLSETPTPAPGGSPSSACSGSMTVGE